MEEKQEIRIAWELSNLINRLNDLIWDRYENEFIEMYLKEEETKYLENQMEEDCLSSIDF